MRDWRDQIRASMKNAGIDPAREAEIIEELNQHFNDRFEDLILHGVSEEEAQKTVMEEFNPGNLRLNWTRP